MGCIIRQAGAGRREGRILEAQLERRGKSSPGRPQRIGKDLGSKASGHGGGSLKAPEVRARLVEREGGSFLL